jgi:hypothetical protein
MLNIKLNLIDPAELKNIQKQKIQFIVKDIISVTFIATAIIGSLMIYSRSILEENYASVLENTSLVSNQNTWFTKEVNDINLSLQDAQLVQQEYFKWTALLHSLNKTIPPDSQMTAINVSLIDNQIILRGISRDRLALLAFKDALEQQKFLTNLASPLTNLLQKENIIFEFRAALLPDQL